LAKNVPYRPSTEKAQRLFPGSEEATTQQTLLRGAFTPGTTTLQDLSCFKSGKLDGLYYDRKRGVYNQSVHKGDSRGTERFV